MKVTLLVLAILCLFGLSAFAQNSYTIKGITLDTANNTKLSATVIVMNAKDSILRKTGLSGQDGSFNLTGLPAGRFIVMVTYPDYADFVERITLDSANTLHDFGQVRMSPKARLLQEIIIQSRINPVKIKGDTTEFNPKAYVIQPNDKVEDLLRQLPGIEIDKDGKITAQGQPVPKVLLDGEEFFSDDPTLVTRNIRADMVGNIQLYDKKSDQAAFTGIDDGVRTKTINIKLKENTKDGYFGKVSGGIGNDGYYEGQGLYNRFKNKFKVSVYGTASNDGKMGLGFQDNTALGMSNVMISDDGDAITIFSGSDQLDLERYRGTGLPESRTGGVHYDNKWNSDKESINTNYKIGSLDINTDQTSLNQANYDSYITKTDSRSNQRNYTFRHKLDAIYSKTLSPTATIKYNVSATQKDTRNERTSETFIYNGENVLRTSENTTTNEVGHTKTLTGDVLYTKKFKKVSRTFSWNVNGNYSHENSTLYLYTDRYTAATASDSITNQYKPTLITALVVNSNMTYTEPITAKLALTFNYGLGLNNSESNKLSYNKSASGNFDLLDNIYSNDYTFNVMTNQVGAIFNYRKNTKTVITFGTRANFVNFKQVDELTDVPYKRDFINWRPQATLQYRPNTSKSFRLDYSGNTQQPTINQIQPVRNNLSSLNTIIGNPDLRPAFRHSLNSSYFSSKQSTSKFFSIFGYLSLTSNFIAANTFIDTSTLRSVTRYENISNKLQYSYSFSTSLSQSIPTLGMNIGVSLRTNGNVNYIYNNNILYPLNSSTYGLGINISKNKAKKYNFFLNGGPNWNRSDGIQSTKNYSDNNSIGYSASARAQIFLPKGFQIASDINDNYKPKTKDLPVLRQTMWNASLSKAFLKDDQLKLSLSANNILNQDQQTTSQSGIYITQSTSNNIRRYFMLTASWDFKHFGTLKN